MLSLYFIRILFFYFFLGIIDDVSFENYLAVFENLGLYSTGIITRSLVMIIIIVSIVVWMVFFALIGWIGFKITQKKRFISFLITYLKVKHGLLQEDTTTWISRFLTWIFKICGLLQQQDSQLSSKYRKLYCIRIDSKNQNIPENPLDSSSLLESSYQRLIRAIKSLINSLDRTRNSATVSLIISVSLILGFPHFFFNKLVFILYY